MSKSVVISNPAFQANVANPLGFNLVNQTNNFNSTFDVKPLDQLEENTIENLLIDNFQSEINSEDQIVRDLDQMKHLTAEIKAIGRQGVILMGERIYKAKEILKSYKYGTLTKWLEATFGSRKTGYNMLAYYELYNSLPNSELKECFKKIPQKAAYILASKTVDWQKKVEFIQVYQNLSANEMIQLIQDQFSFSSKQKSSSVNASLIHSIYENLTKIKKRKNQLSEIQKRDLINLKDIIDNILRE